jgi:HlyD family secretion protein
MKKHALRWIILLILIAAGVAAYLRFSKPEPVEVVVAPVERGVVEKIVANTRAGTVMACRRAKLSPSIGGQIDKLSIKEGDRVKSGQLLIELWNDDLKAQLALAKSEAASAASRARSACLEADVAQREANRLLKLRTTGATSEEAADKASTRAKALQAQCVAAETAIRTAEARIGLADANLARTRLTAPFGGIVAEINGELNEFVTPSPIGIATPPAVDLIDDNCFYVSAPIDEVDAAAIRVGMPARVSLDAFGPRRFDGRVRRIAAYVLDREKQARTVDVEVELRNPQDFRVLLAGYSADVEIILETRTDALRVPTQAVLDGDRVFVWLPADGRLRQRRIETALSNWDYTEVVSGLEPNDRVVVNVDRDGIADGAAARVLQEAP